MAVQESQHLQLAEGFYANALKPMLDIGVGDVDVFLSNHLNLVSAGVAKHTKEMMIRVFEVYQRERFEERPECGPPAVGLWAYRQVVESKSVFTFNRKGRSGSAGLRTSSTVTRATPI